MADQMPPAPDPLDRAREELESAEGADDRGRLDALERLRGELEKELDTSLENGSPGR